VTLLADRYTGRHVRQARYRTWTNKERSPNPGRHLLPAAAALTVAGLLVGGAGAVQLVAGQNGANVDIVSDYDPADYPPVDRDAQAGRTGQDESRTAAGPTAESGVALTQEPATETTKATQPSGSGAIIATGTCDASYYDEPQATASGEIFDSSVFTAAHNSLPFNSRIRVTNTVNGRSVVVRVNDRGPSIAGRCLNLSRVAFSAIAGLDAGVVDVRYEVFEKEAA
jgi:rare lipoprotein A